VRVCHGPAPATSAMDFSPPALCQLFQFMMWLDTWQVATDVPPQLLTRCKQAWLEEVGDTTVSRTQLQVLDAVRQLPGCAGASSEHLTDDGLFSIDIAVQLPGDQKLAASSGGGRAISLSQQRTVRAQRCDTLAQAAAGGAWLARRECAGDRVGQACRQGQAGCARLPDDQPGHGWLRLGSTPSEPTRPRLVTPALILRP
jgi:hypothetical protein